jgi:mono/diheme cytochrome c family protein
MGPAVPAVIRRLAGARRGSGVLLAQLDDRLVAYIADEDEHLVRVVDVEDDRQLSAFAAGGAPAQMVMLADGRLVVAVRERACLLVLRGGGTAKSSLTVDAQVELAAEPIGLALTGDDATLIATSGWGHAVTVLDTHTFARKAEHLVGREPRSVVVSDDGKRAFVSHAVGQELDVIPLDGTKPAKSISVSGSEEVSMRMAMSPEVKRSACQGFALAKTESGRILAPQVLVFAGEKAVSEGYGGGEVGRAAETFHVAVIDEDAARPVPESKMLRAGFDESTRCVLPRAATVGKAGLYVTCLGENTVQLFDADALNPQDVRLARWQVPAGPTAIALDEAQDRAIVWSQFAHALTKIAIGHSRPFALSSMTFVPPKEDAKIARGREIFHATNDLRISGDGRACASCHPDGRDDTLVWSSPKGSRQTPMLAGRLEGAAPYGWNGDAPDIGKHLVSTVKRLGGKGLDGEDKEALIAYLGAMRAPSGTRTRVLAEAIEHGSAIFRSEQAGCASCHGTSGDLPDGVQHDVKSRNESDTQAKFDTPSLRFVGGSAPYFHDGRYPDLHTLLVKSDGKMGQTKQLSSGDLADLEAYLETL